MRVSRRVSGSAYLVGIAFLGVSCGTSDESGGQLSTESVERGATATSALPPVSNEKPPVSNVEAAPTGLEIGTVEGLTRNSDLVVLATIGGIIADLTGETTEPRTLINLQISDVYRGSTDKSTIVVSIATSETLPSFKDQAIVFLRRAPNESVYVADNEKYGQVHFLTPGPNSILEMVGEDLVTRSGGFIGLWENTPTAIAVIDEATGSTIVQSVQATDRFRRVDVMKVIASVGDAPVPVEPDISFPEADMDWLARLDAACAAAKPASAELTSLLEKVVSSGEFSEIEGGQALALFDSTRTKEKTLRSDSTVSVELGGRLVRATEILDRARALLVSATSAESVDETVTLVASFAGAIAEYQLVWVGIPVVSCKEFV
ncbi:MAG: hypothetical protein FD127_3853 [Acidimicrobiaceae bacterium]|jgi:hypothetical protein|nr:MAG: hypothetical protein FD127_3853 [Acidimicrobiaceae bacterium]